MGFLIEDTRKTKTPHIFTVGPIRQLGIDVEVIDLRTLKPMDINTVAESVHKTGRLVTVSKGFGTCGAGREITGQLMEHEFSDGSRGFDYLDAAAVNLAAAEVPPPMSEPLENE